MSIMKSENIRIQRDYIYARDFYKCQYQGCHVIGYDNLQMAHRIAQTKTNAKYICHFIYENIGLVKSITWVTENVLHHRFNIVTSCPEHNSSFNIGNNPGERDKLLMDIIDDLGL